ncbi:alpha/beta hydrolase [Floridanema aerugineum]|uniref:Alpha/beta hydrolase n=1 Tax=Floridaenema aerugineum BLCC-F46 TaxID=3153654 RepID=A0ABV4X6Y0_9CYAN
MNPKRALGAEKIIVQAGLLENSISIESLNTFAKTGKIDRELRFYAHFVGEDRMNELRRVLQRRFRINIVVVSQLTYSPLGEDALKQLGTLIKTDGRINGFYALRAALLKAAGNPDGFTLVDIMEDFPSTGIHINTEQWLQLQRRYFSIVDYIDTTVKAITAQAQQEAAKTPSDFSDLPNPIKPGPYKFNKSTFYLKRLIKSLEGRPIEREYYVDLYVPEGKTRPAPIVIISHGLGSTPAAFAYLGTHLASHGFVVAIPEHIGSGEVQFEDLITGLSTTNVQLTSFVERPLDIKQVIDELEKRSQTDLAGRLDLSRIGVMGHSFGGYTALVSAGATLNLERIRFACSAPTRLRLDISFSFQCLNDVLPSFDTRVLRDSRIKAAIAISPTTSIVFGPKGMGTLNVPTMLIGGSADIVAPFIAEQVNPFFWLKTPDKYLSVIIPAGHTAADATGGDKNPPPNSIAEFLSGPDPVLARQYIRALAVVFMQTYIGDRPEYRTYLNANYAFSIQQNPLQLDLVDSFTPQALEQAYGGSPPIPFFPPPLPKEDN